MNCQHFEMLINDLARGQMVEVATRESALAHIETCARCAARLADEHALTAGLRVVTANTVTTEAPPRVEAALLTAFRQRDQSTPSMPAIKPATALAPMNARRWWRWTMAAAATLLVMFALAVSYLQDRPKFGQVAKSPDVHPTPAESPSPIQDDDTSALVPVQAYDPEDDIRRPAIQFTSKQPRYIARDYRSKGRPSVTAPVNATKAGATEIATDFLPLVDESSLQTMNSGRVIRVELPRSALVSFGLPVNMERTNERVKADVLLGDDGLARAVRFVR